MKKLITVLAFALAIPGMAAQKNCGDVFPKDGVKSSMGLDGAKCVQSKMKNPNGDITLKVKVSEDNAKFKFKMEGTLFYADGSKKPTDNLVECEDVGRGISWECSFKGLKNGKMESENKTLDIYIPSTRHFSHCYPPRTRTTCSTGICLGRRTIINSLVKRGPKMGPLYFCELD